MSSTAQNTENSEQLLKQLEDKIKQDLTDGQIYEALQYVQSFIARKKKVLGQKGTSNAVFLGASLLTANYKLANNAAKPASTTATSSSASSPVSTLSLNTLGSTTGALLKWFIEDGAGLDYHFNLYPELVNNAHYCDVENLFTFLSSIELAVAGPVVEAIYNPLHVLVAKAKIKKNSPLARRINKLEILFAQVFFANKKWLSAFKSYNRLQDAERMADVLLQWSQEGYKHEKALFFARGVLQLLSENKVSLAKDLLHNSLSHVEDNSGKKGGGASSASLAVWHVATILTDLANFPPMPRVDKTKLFGLLFRRYGPLFAQIDSKLFEILQKTGEVVFRFVLENPDAAPNPMAMLQSLLTGGASNKPNNNNAGGRPAPGFDFGNLIQLMSKMGQL
mmetsp:Transcript_23873/g.26130  ORF Transcript_23873/g.26130 Transcript_23873/m.26130 type:complete len:393 (-) Transcript_23873:33-1211(-)|eukprot:CAMPEP_0173150232 /NCGR_PEP_ID=MMETSP1105-20130129/10829_1 /TAXON_ID=2985 /ORGANISM="Ochromonas sp., Strain BG-1" /LENGTH=392 /DNA_ID=CAMNT_0014065311 /DNA_START=127 /DNA_END=1305 /DNA_ORIENTATION=+